MWSLVIVHTVARVGGRISVLLDSSLRPECNSLSYNLLLWRLLSLHLQLLLVCYAHGRILLLNKHNGFYDVVSHRLQSGNRHMFQLRIELLGNFVII